MCTLDDCYFVYVVFKKDKMKAKLTFLVFTAFFLSGSYSFAQQAEVLTEADYQQAVNMLSNHVNKLIDNAIRPQWTADGRVWYQSEMEEETLYKLVDPTRKKVLTAPTRPELFEEGKVEQAAGRRSRRTALSPDGKYEAFIRDWNLWIREVESGEERALTTDGVKDFGYATDNAGWKHSDRAILSWSPDSKKIATFQQDQRHVSTMYLVKTTVGAPELMEWKYPLPEDEDIIRIHRVIIDISGEEPRITRLKLAPDARRGTLCDDISCEGGLDDISWSEDSRHLVFVSTSRDHKEAHVRRADCETGEVSDIFQEIVETQYESGQGSINWKYFSSTNEIVWYSERSDWGHLYLYDAETGSLKHPVTSGEFVVLEVLKWDLENRVIYFLASGKEEGNPYYQYLYRVDFSGDNLKLLTPETGTHSVSFSPDGNYFTDSYSQADVPPVHELRNIQGELITVLERTDISRLEASGWKKPTPFTVRSADDRWDLYGIMHTPSKMVRGKKYPVVLYIYPGPQGGSVRGWGFRSARGDNQALAELGFVVVALEGSCNPGRCKSFHDACYGNMGENTLPDQVSGLKQLAGKYDFLDLDRVGVWGHSGGGFATGAAMFKYPDFFKVGISESGNHDNRNYEDDWGERYIGLEVLDENGVSNYEHQANQTHAENLKGKLMIIHGGMDDNVPPYNSYLVADALIKANKDFDFLLLPNARHGYGTDSNYIMRRRWDYFVQHLLGATPPKEFKIESN